MRHRRFLPFQREFRYSLFYLYLDLAELDQLRRTNRYLAERTFGAGVVARKDFLGDLDLSLEEAVRREVHERIGRRPSGPIRVLTHPRTFGFVFNPVRFYYCFDNSGRQVETVLLEVMNTPWLERRTYVISSETPGGKSVLGRCRKDFHVSPFLPMDLEYRFVLGQPGDSLLAHIDCVGSTGTTLDATLSLRRETLTERSLSQHLWRHPMMAFRGVVSIYWQAFILWLRRVRYHSHP